jgi:hypothetical protein
MKNLKTIVLCSSIIFALGCSSPKIEEKGADTTEVADTLSNKIENSKEQYIGQWDADQFKGVIKIDSDGTFICKNYEIDFEGRGTWTSTPETITFRKVNGDMFPWKSAEEITFKYYDIFAPVIALDGSDGHVDLSFSNHNK